MKKTHDWSTDRKLYANASLVIKDKLNFLITEYQFILKEELMDYGAFLSYIRDEFTIKFYYAAPEFALEDSIIFSRSGCECGLLALIRTGLLPKKLDKLPPPLPYDKLLDYLNIEYIFLMTNIGDIINNYKIIEKKVIQLKESGIIF